MKVLHWLGVRPANDMNDQGDSLPSTTESAHPTLNSAGPLPDDSLIVESSDAPTHWMLTARTRAVEGHDGTQLRYSRWDPPGEPTGTVIILQGMGQRAEAWEESARILTKLKGVRVLTVDWRSQGQSGRVQGAGKRAHVESFDQYTRDFSKVFDDVLAKDIEGPTTMLGYSMGGHLATRIAKERPSLTKKLLLVNPMFDILNYPAVRRVVGIAQRLPIAIGKGTKLAPGQQSGIDNYLRRGIAGGDERRSMRPRKVDAHRPESMTQGVSNQWVRAAALSIYDTNEPGYVESIEADTLIISGAEDQVVNNTAQDRMAERFPNAELLRIPGAYHAPMHDAKPVRRTFWTAALPFIAIKT